MKLAVSLGAVTSERTRAIQQMPRDLEDESVERMLQRYHQGLLTKQELDEFLEMQRRRSEIRERALEAGREPGRALEKD